jgi:cold shock CspA family protein
MQGTVKWFSEEKGYGFIVSDSGEEHYFNVKSIKGASLPSNGDLVMFESKPGDKGPKAFNVSLISKSTTKDNGRSDDRINCPGCGKKIVPRMITYRGEAQKSICPFCAETVKEFSKCFIATAVYGDPCCSQVMALRCFRDDHLVTNILGQAFVGFYYKVSPPVAAWLPSQPWLSDKIRVLLDCIVSRIGKKSGDSPR